VQAALLVADNANGGDPVREISPADYAAAPKLPDLVPTGDDAPPAHTPVQVSPGERGAVCATFTPGTAQPMLSIVDSLPAVAGEFAVTPDPDAVGLVADYIAVPPGRGVLVESLPSPTAPSGSLAVVSDLGQRFAVPSTDVLGVLGYGAVPPQRLPASLVSLVPAGPALDPAAAGRPANQR
jgi:hypothetical protein